MVSWAKNIQTVSFTEGVRQLNKPLAPQPPWTSGYESILDLTVTFQFQGSGGYPFIAITPRSTLTVMVVLVSVLCMGQIEISEINLCSIGLWAKKKPF